MIAHLSFAIPGERVDETADLVAFHHPRPSYPVHLLILPKKEIPGLMDVGHEDQRVLGEVIEAVQILVRQFDLEQKGYRLVVNGGKYQAVPQLHFHLISGE